MKKKILILGAGNAQIDLINYCKELGLEVHGLSYTNTDTGIKYLDKFAQINIIDVDAVREYLLANDIDIIYSVGSDIAVPTINKVAEETGRFHFVSSKVADICCNKDFMRIAIGEKCRYNVPFRCCSDVGQCRDIDFYPLMMKPVDSQGQRGVYKVNNYDELLSRFEQSMSYSKSHKVILEKYIEGDEVSVNAYVKDKKVIFSLVSDRESFCRFPGGIIKAHHLPSVYSNTDTESEINNLVSEVVDILDINNGPLYFQIKVCNGHPYVIEVTPRLDGCHMWKLIKAYCGVDLLEMTVNHLLGNEIDNVNFCPSEFSYHTEFFCEPPETAFDPDKYSDFHAESSVFYYNKGDTVRRMNGFMEKCGYRIFKSPCIVGIVGGSSKIASEFIRMYSDKYEIKNISRSNGSICDYSCSELKNALKGCDSAVICAAKKVDPKEPQMLETYNVNNTIVENTLKACQELGIKNVVFLSSRCVYSQEQPSPIPETGVISPVNYYGIAKRTEELLCEFYNYYKFDNIKTLRVSQVISNDNNGYLIATLIKNAKENLPITIYSSAKRDYIYIKDVCRAINHAIEHYAAMGVYNIGSGIPVSPAELAEWIVKTAVSDSPISCNVPVGADNSIAYLDVSRAERELGFRCIYSIEKSIENLFEEK